MVGTVLSPFVDFVNIKHLLSLSPFVDFVNIKPALSCIQTKGHRLDCCDSRHIDYIKNFVVCCLRIIRGTSLN